MGSYERIVRRSDLPIQFTQGFSPIPKVSFCPPKSVGQIAKGDFFDFYLDSEYFGNIYGDTAVDGTIGAFPCGYAFFGADRMLYGSDYPFGAEAGEDFIRENLNGVKSLAIPPAEKAKILGGNARRLLKID